MAQSGASVECVIARRQEDKPGTGVVFVSPIKGKKAIDAAKRAGLQPAGKLGTLRIEAPDKPGLGAEIYRYTIADAGINLRGISAAVIGNKSIVYLDSIRRRMPKGRRRRSRGWRSKK